MVLIDQTLLPGELKELECRDVETVFEAIQSLRVRGAPAIGIAAAYGVVIGSQNIETGNGQEFLAALQKVCDRLAASRPTAVNLFWALGRMRQCAEQAISDLGQAAFDVLDIRKALLSAAQKIHEDDRQMCHAIGEHGVQALPVDCRGVLTHCNAGGLATAEYGTALSVLFTAQDQGRELSVYVDETRPLLQGARLTSWELTQRGIDTTLICDSMAAQVMREGKVDVVITGADRIAANGDSANKIGTYGLAVLAAHHQIPFFIAAPSSTFDFSLPDGRGIPIEERRAEEITHGFGRATAPADVGVYNPAFDVTPAELITAIITERGVVRPVTDENIRAVLGVA